MALNSHGWGYIRIIAGTIAGGIFGFYVMHKVEVSYKEKMKERLRQYENELKKKEQLNELEDSSMKAPLRKEQFHQNKGQEGYIILRRSL